jgi:saccharopine dehydrogenase-like NADP-dependent oxidoreductase
MTIHWCGTGLSAIPGLRRLLEAGHDVAVWNRTTDKAREAVGDLTSNIHVFDINNLGEMLSPADVVVSMLPGDWHVPLAELAISKGAHFVSSSYIAPEMRALDGKAKDAGVALVNEVGLDPGIDHLMAHALVDDYKASDAFDPANEVSFLSYCGGIPKTPTLRNWTSPAPGMRSLPLTRRCPRPRALKSIQTAIPCPLSASMNLAPTGR